jgi:CheY-like chemotaxis protein
MCELYAYAAKTKRLIYTIQPEEVAREATCVSVYPQDAKKSGPRESRPQQRLELVLDSPSNSWSSFEGFGEDGLAEFVGADWTWARECFGDRHSGISPNFSALPVSLTGYAADSTRTARISQADCFGSTFAWVILIEPWSRHLGASDRGDKILLRIMVVDDDEMVRRSTCGLLKTYPDIEVVCEGADGAEAVTKARVYLPDIILMDITMPTMNGLDATRIIKREMPSIQVVVVSGQMLFERRYRREPVDFWRKVK